MRTELSLPGFDPQECADLARVIEIGRKDPLLSSKEFQRYKTEARKREEKAARKRGKERGEG
ncbi:MAG: hypothetical protein K2L89_08960 [Muribaculaceae bacterium]|nr:hypothetical protein [Muribaculaceae bacterium]